MNLKLVSPKYCTRIVYTIAFAYFAAVIYLVFFSPERRRMPTLVEDRLRLLPFEDAVHFYLNFQELRFIQKQEFLLNFLGNIFLFLPFPYFLKQYWTAAGGRELLTSAFLFSFMIETLQLVTGVGVADVTDIILNTLGAGIGILCVNFIPKNK